MTATTTLSRELKLAIFTGCMISFIGFGFSASFSVFLRPMSIEMGWDEVFSLSLAIQALMWGITQPLAGMYADKHGSSRVWPLGPWWRPRALPCAVSLITRPSSS